MKEACVCGHPRWAHQVNVSSGSEETGFWTEIGACNWDIRGPVCQCKEYVVAPPRRADDGRLVDECGQVKCETPSCNVWHNPEWSDGTPRYGCSDHEEANRR